MKDQTMVLIPDSTIVYPSLFEMTGFQNQEPSYNATFLISKKTDIKPLRDACRLAAFVKWGENVQTQGLRSPIRDGDQKAIDENGNIDKTNFYYGNFFLRAKSKYNIPIVNVYNEEITDPDEIYGGCLVRAYVQFFAYDYMGNRGVSAGLRAVQKIEDGDPIGGNKIDPKQIFPTAPKPEFQPPDMDSREYNEGQGQQGPNRIVGPGQDPWANNEPPQEPPGGLSRQPGDEPEDVPF